MRYFRNETQDVFGYDADSQQGLIDAALASDWEDLGEAWPPIPDHAAQRASAFARVDQVHAEFLRLLTGNATIEERDTWKVKEDAVRAWLNGGASEEQVAMLTAESEGSGISVDALAAQIAAKADAFLRLIGVASGLRQKAKAAVIALTDESVSIEGVGPALDELFGRLSQDVEAAVAKWKTGSS